MVLLMRLLVLVTPESSFPTYEVTQTYMLPRTTLIILDFFQVVNLVLLAIQHVTNTIQACTQQFSLRSSQLHHCDTVSNKYH